MHVPVLFAVSELPEIAQPVAVPFVALNVTAPALLPPVVESLRTWPTMPLAEVTVSGAWVAGLTT